MYPVLDFFFAFTMHALFSRFTFELVLLECGLESVTWFV
jgi:hypothetical protein